MIFLANHKRKVNDVYPSHAGEEGAVSSKLGLLTHYLQARPVKLVKVFHYLETKVQLDLDRERSGYNKVTLEMIEAILETCSSDLKIFAGPSMRIIFWMISSEDVHLMVRATTSFNKFMTYLDPSSFVTDLDLIWDVNKVLKKFTDLCDYESEDERQEKQVRFASLTALKALIMKDPFNSNESSKRIEIFVPGLLKNMTECQLYHRPERSSSASSASRRNSNYDELVNEEGLDRICLSALDILVRKCSNVCFSCFISQIFNFMDKCQWSPLGYVLSIMKVIFHGAPMQSLLMFVSHLFRMLDSTQTSKIRITVMETLTQLIGTAKTSIGLSAVELSLAIYRQLKKSVNLPLNSEEEIFQRSCVACFDMMSKHREYVVQKYDVLTLILNKAGKLTNFPSRMDDDQSSTSNMITLTTEQKNRLRSIMLEITSIVARTDFIFIQSIDLMSKINEQLCYFLLDPEPNARLWAMISFKELYSHGCRLTETEIRHRERSLSSPSPVVKGIPKTPARERKQIIHSLHSKIRYHTYKYLLFSTNQPPHYIAAFQAVTAICNSSSEDDIVNYLPMMLSLQTLLDKESITHSARRCLSMMIISFFEWVASYFQVKPLQMFLTEFIKERRLLKQWYPIDMISQEFTTITTFEALDHNEKWNPVDKTISKKEFSQFFSQQEIISALQNEYQVDSLVKEIGTVVTLLAPNTRFNRSGLDLVKKIPSTYSLPPHEISHSITVKNLKEALYVGKKNDQARKVLRNAEIKVKASNAFMQSSTEILNKRNEIEEEANDLLFETDDIVESDEADFKPSIRSRSSLANCRSVSLLEIATPPLP